MSTLSTLITRISRRLEDTQQMHWPQAEVIGAINEAKNDLYDYIFSRNRDVLDTLELTYTWPADVLRAPLSTVAPNNTVGTYDILLMSVTSSVDTVDKDNKPIPMSRVNFEELYRHGRGPSLFYDDYQYVDNSGATVSGQWSGGSGSSTRTAYRWAQQGHTIYLDPVPSVDVQLYLQIVRRFFEFDEAGTELNNEVFPDDEILFRRWERIIEYMACLSLKGRSDEQQESIAVQLGNKMSLLESWLDAKSQAGTVRVRIDGY